MRERGGAIPIRNMDVRTGFDQQPQNLGVRRTTIAEDHGLQERGPAEIVDVVLVDRGAEQKTYRLDMTMMRGRDQRRSAIAIGAR